MKKYLSSLGLAGGLALSGPALAEADLSGVWQAQSPAQELKTVRGETSPLRKEAAAIYQQRRDKWRKGDLSFDPSAQCVVPGFPRIMSMPYPFEILQSKQKIIFMFEWNYWNRQIFLKKQAQEAPYPMALGMSNGRWDGDVLEVRTGQFSANTLLDSAGMPHSESLVVTERLQLVKPDILEARYTIEDPETFTQPWETVVRFARLPKGTEIREDVCLDRIEAGKVAASSK